MESINRLREYVASTTISAWTQNNISQLIDAIEREHQKDEDKWKAEKGDIWLRGYAVCHKELMEGHPVIAADLEKAGWVKLPLDAEGEPIHIGDVMEWPDSSTAEVVGIGNGTFFYVEDGEDAAEWSSASDKIHYHALTVEDVLCEFSCVLMGKREFDGDIAEAITKYAAKLRLADHAEA